MSRLAIELNPQGIGAPQIECPWEDGGQLPLGSVFGLNLQVLLPYMAGECSVPAAELPDLLHAVYDIVRGTDGCEDLEAAVLAEHQRIAQIPLMDDGAPLLTLVSP
jgi:hypothetical protein